MKLFLSVLILITVLAISAVPQTRTPTEPPADFRGGCSLFPEGNYRECCQIHDRDYFRGGSAKERRQSDKRLYRCVRSKKGWKNEIAAPIMYLGVRVLGVSILPTPFRWGFGQKKKRT